MPGVKPAGQGFEHVSSPQKNRAAARLHGPYGLVLQNRYELLHIRTACPVRRLIIAKSSAFAL
jgi:hypothetical protein